MLTPEEMLKATDVINFMRSRMETAQGRMEELSARVLKDPSSALSYSHDDFVHAARLAIMPGFLGAMTEERSKATLATLTDYAREKALRIVLYPPHSTSPTCNLMEQAHGTVWAELFEWLSGFRC